MNEASEERRRAAQDKREHDLDVRWFSKYGHVSPSTWVPRMGEKGPRIYCADPNCNCHKYPLQD